MSSLYPNIVDAVAAKIPSKDRSPPVDTKYTDLSKQSSQSFGLGDLRTGTCGNGTSHGNGTNHQNGTTNGPTSVVPSGDMHKPSSNSNLTSSSALTADAAAAATQLKEQPRKYPHWLRNLNVQVDIRILMFVVMLWFLAEIVESNSTGFLHWMCFVLPFLRGLQLLFAYFVIAESDVNPDGAQRKRSSLLSPNLSFKEAKVNPITDTNNYYHISIPINPAQGNATNQSMKDNMISNTAGELLGQKGGSGMDDVSPAQSRENKMITPTSPTSDASNNSPPSPKQAPPLSVPLEKPKKVDKEPSIESADDPFQELIDKRESQYARNAHENGELKNLNGEPNTETKNQKDRGFAEDRNSAASNSQSFRGSGNHLAIPGTAPPARVSTDSQDTGALRVSASMRSDGSAITDSLQQSAMTKQLSKVSFAPDTWTHGSDSYDEDGNPKRRSTLKLKNKYAKPKPPQFQNNMVSKRNTDNTMMKSRESSSNDMGNFRKKNRAKSAHYSMPSFDEQDEDAWKPVDFSVETRLKPIPPAPTLWNSSPNETDAEENLGDIAEEGEEEETDDDGFTDDMGVKDEFNKDSVNDMFKNKKKKPTSNENPAENPEKPATGTGTGTGASGPTGAEEQGKIGAAVGKLQSIKKTQSVKKQKSSRPQNKPNVKETGSIGGLTKNPIADHGVFSPLSQKFRKKSDVDDIPFIANDPVNLSNIKEQDYIDNAKEMLESDESFSSEEEDEEEYGEDGETWEGGAADVDMPDWLVAKLKANGWKPPEEAENNPAMEKRLSANGKNPVGKTQSTGSQGRNVYKTFSELSTRSSVEGNANFLGTLPNEQDGQVWRVPMPSRRASEQQQSPGPKKRRQSEITAPTWMSHHPSDGANRLGAIGEDEEDTGQAVQTLGKPSTGTKASGGRRQSRLEKQQNRRTSVSAMMRDFNANPQQKLQEMFDGTNKPGQGRQRSASVINVRKQSVMLEGDSFLRELMSPEELAARGVSELSSSDIICLPFFKAKEVPRKCNCKGGIHTCMTPASTMAMNSVYQSYVCSTWASRIHSLFGSEQGSRRASVDVKERTRSRRGSEWNNSNMPILEEDNDDLLHNELTVSVIESSNTKQQKEDHQIDAMTPQDTFIAVTRNNTDVIVIDVRGRDHEGGHVPGSIHITTQECVKNPGWLVSEIRQKKAKIAVFTCMYSVLRARKCCHAVQEFQKREQSDPHRPMPVQLKLLAGGFHGYLNAFAHDIHGHVEGYKDECWTQGPQNLGLVHVMDALWSEGGQKKLIKNLEEELQKLSEKNDATSRNPSEKPKPALPLSNDKQPALSEKQPPMISPPSTNSPKHSRGNSADNSPSATGKKQLLQAGEKRSGSTRKRSKNTENGSDVRGDGDGDQVDALSMTNSKETMDNIFASLPFQRVMSETSDPNDYCPPV